VPPGSSREGCKKDIVRLFNELNFTWLEKQPGYTIKIRGPVYSLRKPPGLLFFLYFPLKFP
jgi:hypothetical protein